MAAKLTKAQRELLKCIEHVQMPVADHYEPAKKLVEKGFAEWRGGAHLDNLAITDAGRTALSQHQGGGRG